MTPKRVKLGTVAARRWTNCTTSARRRRRELRQVGGEQQLGEWADDSVELKVTRIRGHASRSG